MGWQIEHQERLLYRAKSGSPVLIIKFFNYPDYLQQIKIIQQPNYTKLKKKGLNSYFLFHRKVRTSGLISFDRIIQVLPHKRDVSLQDDWGKISNISKKFMKKYQTSTEFWPQFSSLFQDPSLIKWFEEDYLKDWIMASIPYIRSKIKNPEKLEERVGVFRALNEGIGDCDEFTDLFLTLARRRGIPSRRLTGYHVQNTPPTPIPHAWAEIYSPIIGWITIDLALLNIGKHTDNYVILKIEEFHSNLADYSVSFTNKTQVNFEWIRKTPDFIKVNSD
ncbi:transglutaminase-like domain-containing protein [Candidatus Hodarchaeum mangrovi]